MAVAVAVAVAVMMWRRRWRWRDATAAVVAVPHLIEELEGGTVYAAYTPDLSVSVESGLVGLTVGRWQVGW